MERGVGDDAWVNLYIGIPFVPGGRDGICLDCYGLVKQVYQDVLKINLPDWVTDSEIDWEGERSGSLVMIDRPEPMCLIRVPRSGNMPDHWGIFVGGGVLTMGARNSCFISLNKFMETNPYASFYHYVDGAIQ